MYSFKSTITYSLIKSSSLSGVAFLLADTRDLLLINSKDIFERIKKFMTIHRNGFLLLSAALHGPKEWEMIFRIQQRYKIIKS